MTELTVDYPVEGYNRVSRTGKRHSVSPHERNVKGKLHKEIVMLKVEKLKKEQELKTRIKDLRKNRKKILKHLKRINKGKGVYLRSDKREFLDLEGKTYKLIHSLEAELILLKRKDFTLTPVISREDTVQECVSVKMSKMYHEGEDKKLTKEQMLGKAFGICREKKDFTLTPVIQILRTDNIPFSEFKELKTDFDSKDFVIFHGPIARDGPYDYTDGNGNTKTLYKDIDNLKDIYSRYNYLPIKTSEKVGAHYAEEFGYATNFSVNEETNEIEADLILVNDEGFKKILSKKSEYHVSPGYNDIIKDGNIQMITDVDHIALALGAEIGRACTGTNSKGASCTKVRKTHDQNLIEVINN